MKQTRRLVISDRVFRSKDLLRITNILSKQKEIDERELGGKKYEVKFDDDTTIESDSPEVIAEEWLSDHGRRPIRISMSYHSYKLDRHIDVDLSHGGGSYGNELRVSGSDADWVLANFLALKEALEAVRPQDVWIRRHSTLLLNLIALGIGCLGDLLIWLGVVIVEKLGVPRPNGPWIIWMRQRVSEHWLLFLMYEWIFRYASGFFWGAFAVRSWLLAMWPSIEFEFGPAHLQREKTQRQRLYSVAALVIVPILVTLLCDLLERAF